MSEEAYNLRPVWDALLNIYTEFAKICDRHHLRYYVTGGTLLGAARHKGFIPWDDDFDVVMPRSDYRRFFDACAKELPAGLVGYDFHNPIDPGYWVMFGKVASTRKDLVVETARQSGLALRQGLYIDVIPIDGMPRATVSFYWWALRRSIRKRYCMRSKSPESRKARYRRFEKWLMKWDYDHSPAVDDYNTNGRRLKTRALTSRSFGDPVWLPFEQVKVPCPHDWERFLELIFGDWRALPPESQRNPVH